MDAFSIVQYVKGVSVWCVLGARAHSLYAPHFPVYGTDKASIKMPRFLTKCLPSVLVRRHDKQLVSHDEHTSTYNYKYTFSIELIPLCKDDLVCLPAKVGPGLVKLSSRQSWVDPA